MSYIFVGTIVGLKGLNGTLKVAAENEVVLSSSLKVKVGYSLQYSEEFTVLEYKFGTSKYSYLRLVEIDNIISAKKLVEKGVFVNVLDVSNNFVTEDYSKDLNFDVYDVRSGKFLGKAISIIPNPGNDLILVVTENGEFFLPFVDAIVKKFDKMEKAIFIELIDGLLE
ncbi:MAG: hypothetical protein N2560_00685 [Ignavibacteria bacterium]|nr:hypothetical protein [Ignavibacteria bacterium]